MMSGILNETKHRGNLKKLDLMWSKILKHIWSK
jgi:hypothetical protein